MLLKFQGGWQGAFNAKIIKGMYGVKVEFSKGRVGGSWDKPKNPGGRGMAACVVGASAIWISVQTKSVTALSRASNLCSSRAPGTQARGMDRFWNKLYTYTVYTHCRRSVC